MTADKDYYDRLLRPIKSKAKNRMPIFGFDVETEHVSQAMTRKSGRHQPYHRQDFVMGSVIGDGIQEIFWDRKEMCDYLLSRKLRGGMIAATNLEFDLNMLFHDRLKDFFMIYRHGLLAAIHKRKVGGTNKRWTFVDTSNYMKAPLSALGRIVGIRKLSHPSTFIKNPQGIGLISHRPKTEDERIELTRYNLNDSMITYRFMEHFRQFCETHNMRLKLTIGSTGMDFWRRNHQSCIMKREPDDLIYKHFEGSFKGGMTSVFKRGTYPGRLWYYDYRSSYPAVMVQGIDHTGEYPDPSTYAYIKRPSTEHLEDFEGISRCTIDMPYMYSPPLGYKTESKKLIFPYGTFDGWYTHLELRRAMAHGAEVTPHESIIYTANFRPFKAASRYLYDLRKKYKDEGHPYQAMVKVLMNSGLFGKWGTNFTQMEELIPVDEIHFNDDGRAFIGDKDLLDFALHENSIPGVGVASIKKEGTPFRYSFPVLSSYTTALARIRLWSDTRYAQKELVYCDTDSAIVTRPVFSDSDELGGWELEHECLAGCVFVRPKFYRLSISDECDPLMTMFNQKNIFKSKGVGRYINEDTTFYRCISTGLVDLERFTKMRESSRMGIRSGSVIKMSKCLSMEDDKRLWPRKFCIDDWQDSQPICL